MKSVIQGRTGGRKAGRGSVALAGLLLVLGIVLLAPAAPRAQIGLSQADLRAALSDIEAMGAFFGALAQRDTNGFAQERWRQLGSNYRGTAETLQELLDRGILVLQDLPAGRTSAELDDGHLVIDPLLDGRWLTSRVSSGGETTAAARRQDLLLPVMMAALARRLPPERWPWMADHLSAAEDFSQLAAQPLARPWLAQFFHAKDAYLWLALRRGAESDPAARLRLAERQAARFALLESLHSDLAATFGFAPADRLQTAWSGYVAEVDSFVAKRAWVLLDPALRRTQVGDLARADADAVERAAAEMLAEAPRSALAEARARGAGPQRQPDASPDGGAAQSMEALLAPPPDKLTPAELAARLPLETLALAPSDFAGSGDPAAFEAFTARLKEALAQPDPRQLVAEKEAALSAARAEVASLENRVGELDAALQARKAEAERLQSALAAAEAARATEAADAVAPPEAPRPERAPVKETAPEATGTPEAPAAAAEPDVLSEMIPALQRIENRQAYLTLAVAAVFFFVLLLWLCGRRAREKSVPQPPRLLSSPALAQAAAKPVIDVEPPAAPAAAPVAAPVTPEVEETASPEAPDAAKESSPPDDPPLEPARLNKSETGWSRPHFQVNGVTPPTREARAAMKAGVARSEAARAATQPGEVAAAQHPMVKALRSGNLPLFEMLLGEMTGLKSPRLQRIVYGGQGEDLVVACRAKGVEKLLFGSIFMLTDHLRGGDADEDPARAAEVLAMYDRLPPEVAQQLLAKWQNGGAGGGSGDPGLG